MKYLALLFLLISSTLSAQLSKEQVRKLMFTNAGRPNGDFDKYDSQRGYASSYAHTKDGGVFFFAGENENTALAKFDSEGQLAWRTPFQQLFDDHEVQCVLQGHEEGYYAFLISYDRSRYRGGSERIIHLDKDGKLLWDIVVGEYTQLNNPYISYAHLLEDGRIELRGHISPNPPREGKSDPDVHFWTGFLTPEGEITQEIGEKINWSDASWQEFYEMKE